MFCVNQGDVHVWESALPPTATKSSRRRVREGEVTGHAHVLVGDNVEVFEDGDRLFCRVVGEGVELVHNTHHAVSLPAGKTVEFGPTYMYDYDTAERAEVRD